MATIEQINNALERYYKSLNQPYQNQFTIFCDDNGYDDEGIGDELDDQENDLNDFDEDFPISHHIVAKIQDKSLFIHKILSTIYQSPEIQFSKYVQFATCRYYILQYSEVLLLYMIQKLFSGRR